MCRGNHRRHHLCQLLIRLRHLGHHRGIGRHRCRLVELDLVVQNLGLYKLEYLLNHRHQ